MFLKYIRLAAVILAAIITYYVYTGETLAPYKPPLDPGRPIENTRDALNEIGIQHMNYVKDLMNKVAPAIGEACSPGWSPNFIHKLFSKNSEYDAHRQWVNTEIRRLEEIEKQNREPYNIEIEQEPLRTHSSNGDLHDDYPELPEYRAYVESMEAKVANGSIFANIPGIKSGSTQHNGTLVLLSAAHGLSAKTANPRSEWAKENGFEHIAIDLDKYMVNQTAAEIGVTANWLHLAAMEEALYRSNADWIWYLDTKYSMDQLERADPFVLLGNLASFQLEKFPLHSTHRDLRNGMIPPPIDPKETVFVAASNRAALDTSSLFIRNNDAAVRYMQMWSARPNLIDYILEWNYDDQFDNKSEEAFSHMYAFYHFLRKRTAVVPQNTIWNSRRTE